MLFQVLAQGQFGTPAVYPRAILKIDNWNDWFEFTTLYYLTVHDSQGTLHRIGGVKIGEVGMQEGQLRPNLPDSFDALSESFFSLGQDDSYYENLNKLGEDL